MCLKKPLEFPPAAVFIHFPVSHCILIHAQTRIKEALIIFMNSKEIEVGWRLSVKRNQPDGPANSNQSMQMICSHFSFPRRIVLIQRGGQGGVKAAAVLTLSV